MSMYNELLEQAGGDPRALAAAAVDPVVAALLGLSGIFFPATTTPRSSYNNRLEQAGGDPRTLATAAANPEVAAMFGLKL